MFRYSYLIVSILFSLFFCCLQCVADAPQGKEKQGEALSNNPITVGAILPLSGNAAGVGVAVQNGMELALRKLPEQVRKRILIRYEDDGLEPRRTVSSFQKLRTQGKLDLVINTSSGTAKALAPISEKTQTPFIAIASDKEIVEGRSWVVNHWVTPDTEGALMGKEVAARGYKNVAVIVSSQAGFMAIQEGFLRHVGDAVNIASRQEVPVDIKDFRSVVTKLRSVQDLDAVGLFVVPGSVGLLAKQIRQLGIKAPIFGAESFELQEEVELSDGALLGTWYANADEPGHDFLKMYHEAYPDSSSWGAANGYDAILLLADAMKHGAETKEDINRYLHELKDFSGALGVYSVTNDNRFTLPAVIKKVTKNGFEVLNTGN